MTEQPFTDPRLINQHPPSWLGCEVAELGVELPSGKIATTMDINRTGVMFGASESFGTGTTPYADEPDTHESYLASPDVVSTEGTVTYDRDGEAVSLPKQVFFEHAFAFESPINADTASDLAAQVEARLTNLDAVTAPVSVSPPESLLD